MPMIAIPQFHAYAFVNALQTHKQKCISQPTINTSVDTMTLEKTVISTKSTPVGLHHIIYFLSMFRIHAQGWVFSMNWEPKTLKCYYNQKTNYPSSVFKIIATKHLLAKTKSCIKEMIEKRECRFEYAAYSVCNMGILDLQTLKLVFCIISRLHSHTAFLNYY